MTQLDIITKYHWFHRFISGKLSEHGLLAKVIVSPALTLSILLY